MATNKYPPANEPNLTTFERSKYQISGILLREMLATAVSILRFGLLYLLIVYVIK